LNPGREVKDVLGFEVSAILDLILLLLVIVRRGGGLGGAGGAGGDRGLREGRVRRRGQV
jgi:hypothetical protein